MNSAVGAASTAAVARLDAFEAKVVEYQTALRDLWQLSRNNRHGRGPAAAISQARAKVKQAFAALEKAYSAELSRYAPLAWRNKNRGDALSNAERGATLATRKPNSPKMDPRIQVANRVQASWLTSCTKTLKVAGNAALLLDAVLRAKGIVDIHNAGGDWMRESARQLTGFGAGAAAGIYIGGATITAGSAWAASAGLMVAGPIGWAVLGVVVAVGLVSGFAAGYFFDSAGKTFADWIMEGR